MLDDNDDSDNDDGDDNELSSSLFCGGEIIMTGVLGKRGNRLIKGKSFYWCRRQMMLSYIRVAVTG